MNVLEQDEQAYHVLIFFRQKSRAARAIFALDLISDEPHSA